MGGDEVARHKHPNKEETAKTRRELDRMEKAGMSIADAYRKINASTRIKKLGGLGYQSVLYYYHQCKAA